MLKVLWVKVVDAKLYFCLKCFSQQIRKKHNHSDKFKVVRQFKCRNLSQIVMVNKCVEFY